MSSRGPLGLSLRSGGLGAGVVAAVAVAVSALVAGARGAVSAGCGAVLVLMFFVGSLYLVEVANRVAPAFTLPVGLTVYSTFLLWLGVLAFGTSLPDKLDRHSFAWTVISATLGWVLLQATAVWRKHISYVDVELPSSEQEPDLEPEAPQPATHSVTDSPA
jgi:ATP synthase protein I